MAREPMTDNAMTTDRALDQRLRQSLSPDELTIDRLVTQALTHSPTRTARAWPPTRSWQLAAGLIVAILVVVALPVLGPRSPAPENITTAVLEPATASKTSEIVGSGEVPALLRISNEDGPVTVTTVASKVVFLAPER